MSQHDYDIANQSFPAFRTDLNNVLGAINSTNSGSSRPSSAVAGTIWLDTSGAATAQLLKMYDGAADILLGTVNFTANTIDWADSTLADGSVTTAKLAYNPNPFRNIIINGDMSLAQRSTSVTGITGGGYNTLDRWNIDLSSLGTWTMSQSTDVPSGYGFAKSLKLDCTTADASPAAGNRFLLEEKFEGQNLQYLKKGTSNAESLTASFWVKSTKTGTFIAGLYDADNNRNVSKSYTVSDSNTWEFKTVTFPGDTSGAFGNDTGASLSLQFWLAAGTDFTSGTLATSWAANDNTERAAGQVNIADNTANNFFITGTQLEAGTTASDFEFLPYDVNLQRCQRYYYLHVSGSQDVGLGGYYSSSHIFFNITFPTTMRAVPTIVYVSGTDYYKIIRNSATDNFNDIAGGGVASLNEVSLYNNSQVSGTAGHAGYVRSNNASASIALNSEL